MRPNEKVFIDQIRKGVLSIDSQGRIWRHRKWVNYNAGYRILERPERAELRNNGYLELSKRDKDTWVRAKASRIVWIYFHGDIPNNLQINHINGIRNDNRLKNLELVTTSENVQHAYRIGLAHGRPGEKHHNAHLKETDIKKIRKLYKPRDGQSYPMTDKPRYSMAGLARMFGVSPSQIGRIILGKRWKHVH